jgi:hypothetical protein
MTLDTANQLAGNGLCLKAAWRLPSRSLQSATQTPGSSTPGGTHLVPRVHCVLRWRGWRVNSRLGVVRVGCLPTSIKLGETRITAAETSAGGVDPSVLLFPWRERTIDAEGTWPEPTQTQVSVRGAMQ